MRKILFTAGLLWLCCFSLSAAPSPEADSLKIWDEAYKEEEGFFMKAYRDVSDPTFMFTDTKGNFSVGIGGQVQASAFFDFYGSIDAPKFNTALISIPSDKARHFGYTTEGSNIYVKARGQQGKHKLTAYLEFNDDGDKLTLNQGYVSLDKFTIGKTHSFFEDLQAGVRTVDLRGPNTQIDNTHCLVGYSGSMGKSFRYGIAFEEPSEISSAYAKYVNYEAEFSRFPDVAAHFKYNGKIGHFQIGGLLCERSYFAEGWAGAGGKSIYKGCWGVSVSGTLIPFKGMTLSGQAVGGRGISKYIKELSSLDDDLLYDNEADDDGYPILSPAPVYGGYIGASYRISESLETSAVIGYSHLEIGENQISATNFKSSCYMTVNLFWFLSSRCMAGLEYANGKKVIYTLSDVNSGVANRFNARFIYRF